MALGFATEDIPAQSPRCTGAKVILQGPVRHEVDGRTWQGEMRKMRRTGKLEKEGREERGEGRGNTKSPNPKS